MKRVTTLGRTSVITAFLITTALGSSLAASSAGHPPHSRRLETAVINVMSIPASRAAGIIRSVFPGVTTRVDRASNALIITGSAEQVETMRELVAGIDVRNPTAPVVDTLQVHTVRIADVIERIRSLYPHARLISAPNNTIVLEAAPQDISQLKAVIVAIDTPPATPTPRPSYPYEAVRITQRSARDVARTVAHAARNVHVAVSGSEVLLSGPPDAMIGAKLLVTQLDEPQAGAAYTQVYRLHYVDATSVAALLQRSFRNLSLQVDGDLNAISVLAPASLQQRISTAINQLDASTISSPSGAAAAFGAGALEGNIDVVNLRAAIPGLNGATSTSATDIATTVSQTLSTSTPDLKITVPPNSTQLVLYGSPYSIKLAKSLIDKLDVPQPLVVLDTEVLEVDETYAKNLGLQLPQGGALLSTQFTEQMPAVPSDGSVPPPLQGFQPFARTPLQFSLQLNLLIQQNKARVLADPRITTVSGRTASIRAGDTISVLTTSGGGSGTVATTQIQQFQTGITLDITPVVNAGDFITVMLHPTVNSETGILNGVPQIATRDTQTTVGLKDNQTLVIGGLIQESSSRLESKMPLLGDLPLIGKAFRSSNVNSTRNELIITVTPHIVRPSDDSNIPGPALPPLPTPGPLPTLPPGTRIPNPESSATPTLRHSVAPTTVASAELPSIPSSRESSSSLERRPPTTLPAAFNQTNIFTYGSAPPNNFASPEQPPQIFFVQAGPTVITDGSIITLSVITSTNVARLSFGSTPSAMKTPFSEVGPGQWQATIPFNGAAVSAGSGRVQMMLTASTARGATVSLPIPFSVASP